MYPNLSGNEVAMPPQIHTYHCICTNLLFAGTKPLDDLPRRSGELDKAYILSLPSAARTADELEPPETDDVLNRNTATHGQSYARLVSTNVDRKPLIIRRDDGFEKRYLQRCGRCRVVVGYQLDWAQYPEIEGIAAATGLREDVVYLLPGGMLSTEEMVTGKDMSKSISLGAG